MSHTAGLFGHRFPFHDTIHWELDVAPTPPDSTHLLGTQGWGSDARKIVWICLSVLFGLSLTLVTLIGVTVGALQGFFGGAVDLLGQRVVEIGWASSALHSDYPCEMFEPNVFLLLMILACFNWMVMVGLVRAEFLRARNF